MRRKPAVTREPIHELLAERWSSRAFDSERRVDRRALISLLEAARWAPSCGGQEPWRYVVCDRYVHPRAWQAAFDCLSEGNRRWAGAAPILILAVAERYRRDGERLNRWGEHDTGAASLSLSLQAMALGLAVHQMGGFDPERARAAFGVPDTCTPMAIIAVGHPGAEERLAPELAERERAERQRQPLAAQCFEASWGRAIRPDDNGSA